MNRPLTLLPLLFILLLFSCARTNSPVDLTAEQRERADCKSLWVFAPENYIIELAAGSEVVLNPRVQDFPLFCSREEALKSRSSLIRSHELPASGLALYKLNGDLESLAREIDGKLYLSRAAELVTWEQLPSQE